MKVKRAWLGVALLATLIIFSVLTLVAWDFVREAIVVPLTYLIWLGGLILKSISQEIYLVLLIAVALFIALNTLNKLRIRTPNNSMAWTAPGDASRYRSWLRLCTSARASEYSRQELAREVRKLILSILAYQEGLGLSEAEQKIVSGDLPAPATVRNLFHERDLMFTPQPRQRFWQRLMRNSDKQPDPALTQSLEEIVQFIENRLEIVHDGNPLSAPH